MSNLGRSYSQPYVVPRKLSQQQGQNGDLPKVDISTKQLLLPDLSLDADIFEVEVERNTLGLGFSIMGGSEAPAPWTNIIRIKKLFPLQPAWQTGKLKIGDIILKVSGIPLTGLNLRQSLDILRTSPSKSSLTICRVQNEAAFTALGVDAAGSRKLSVIRSYSYTPATFNPANREAAAVIVEKPKQYGEFSVVLTKVNSSLGFTLSKHSAAESHVLRHAIKALVKEPALSEPRLQPGDKLVTANGQDCDSLTHSELIQFLRSCPDQVTLTLYRDASRKELFKQLLSQTPLSPLNEPAEETSHSRPVPALLPGFASSHESDSSLHLSSGKGKPLRFEAREMVRSLQASRSSLDNMSPANSFGTSPLPAHRRGLAQSPHGWKHNHLRGTASGSDVLATSAPTIESPLSPIEPTSLPPLFLRDAQEKMGELKIEELSPNEEECFEVIASEEGIVIEDVSDSEFSALVELHEANNSQERPRDLDLFSSCHKRKAHYQFNPNL